MLLWEGRKVDYPTRRGKEVGLLLLLLLLLRSAASGIRNLCGNARYAGGMLFMRIRTNISLDDGTQREILFYLWHQRASVPPPP